jgi:hypothetical protein
MKRTIPLLITAAGGLVLILAVFSPYTESWGEKAAIWFDILAAIAFVLGGGNLLKMHLKKISDRQAGWGYSAVTVASFLVMLYAGMVKWGSPPAANQEHYGEVFVPLRLDAFPLAYEEAGAIPASPTGEPLPSGARRQVSDSNGTIRFVGWMDPSQRNALRDYYHDKNWHALVGRLYERAQPPEALRERTKYYADLEMLAYQGRMTPEAREALLALNDSPVWQDAVKRLYQETQREARVPVRLPRGLAPARLAEISSDVSYDQEREELVCRGPMSLQVRQQLIEAGLPTVRWDAQQGERLAADLAARGPLSVPQRVAIEAVSHRLAALGPLTRADVAKDMFRELALAGPLTSGQRDFLLAPYRDSRPWRAAVDRLFLAAHQTKFAWSGDYRAEGTPFWWLYEYAMKPLTATMFAMLAFYVASAAFRAFRAKNVEATLLLATAFIILLGRTFAGQVLTGWLPDWLGWLRIDRLSAEIMSVYNTAGTRAIMIGIALGIASTSLKVLLGIDRSYLGTDRE